MMKLVISFTWRWTNWVAGGAVDENVTASSTNLGENDEQTVKFSYPGEFVFTLHCLLLGQLVCRSMDPPAPAAMPPAPTNRGRSAGAAIPPMKAAATPAPMMLLGSTPRQLLAQVVRRPWSIKLAETEQLDWTALLIPWCLCIGRHF